MMSEFPTPSDGHTCSYNLSATETVSPLLSPANMEKTDFLLDSS